MASLEYDPKASALYIRLKPEKPVSSEPLSDTIILDLNEEGEAVGIEVLLPKTTPPEIKEKLFKAIRKSQEE